MVKLTVIYILLLFTSFSIYGQEPATEEGEDLDLQGVAALFKDSESLEEFEQKLNSEDQEVNNLDLNQDDQVDYLRVLESTEETTHLIVVQASLGEDAYQDVCTIEVDKDEDGNTYVQIVGDKAIYGDDYILEPPEEEQEKVNKTTIVVILFAPGYRPWRSPWRWGRYPHWFRPWRPIPRATYRNRMVARYPRKGHWRNTKRRKSSRATTMHRNTRKATPRARTTPRGRH